MEQSKFLAKTTSHTLRKILQHNATPNDLLEHVVCVADFFSVYTPLVQTEIATRNRRTAARESGVSRHHIGAQLRDFLKILRTSR